MLYIYPLSLTCMYSIVLPPMCGIPPYYLLPLWHQIYYILTHIPWDKSSDITPTAHPARGYAGRVLQLVSRELRTPHAHPAQLYLPTRIRIHFSHILVGDCSSWRRQGGGGGEQSHTLRILPMPVVYKRLRSHSLQN